jgi:hypothetical protein
MEKAKQEPQYPTSVDEQIIYLSNFMRKEFPHNVEHDFGAIPSIIEIVKEQKRILSMTKLSEFDEFMFIGKSLETLNMLLADWKRKKVQNANIFADRNIAALQHDIAILSEILTAHGNNFAQYFATKYNIEFKIFAPEKPKPEADESKKEQPEGEGKTVSLTI